MLRRGLRFKSGLDCGDVLAQVHTTTGRMTYRGRVMNRSARIAGLATAGQVGIRARARPAGACVLCWLRHPVCAVGSAVDGPAHVHTPV